MGAVNFSARLINLARIDLTRLPLVLAQRLAFEFQPVGVVDEAIQNGVGHGGVVDQFCARFSPRGWR